MLTALQGSLGRIINPSYTLNTGILTCYATLERFLLLAVYPLTATFPRTLSLWDLDFFSCWSFWYLRRAQSFNARFRSDLLSFASAFLLRPVLRFFHNKNIISADQINWERKHLLGSKDSNGNLSRANEDQQQMTCCYATVSHASFISWSHW